jgi:hypothetical protein
MKIFSIQINEQHVINKSNKNYRNILGMKQCKIHTIIIIRNILILEQNV